MEEVIFSRKKVKYYIYTNEISCFKMLSPLLKCPDSPLYLDNCDRYSWPKEALDSFYDHGVTKSWKQGCCCGQVKLLSVEVL